MNVKIYNLNKEFVNEERQNGNYYAFMSSESLEQHGLKIERCNYDLVWNHDFESEISLDELYKIFNSDYKRPSDFRGHSMSVSDVVVIDGAAYYCDDIGWLKLPDNWCSGLSSRIQDNCNLCQCESACRYGCKCGKIPKLANDGEGITAMVGKNGNPIYYYVDILDCVNWK